MKIQQCCVLVTICILSMSISSCSPSKNIIQVDHDKIQTQGNYFCNINNFGHFVCSEQYIYFVDPENAMDTLYRCNLNGEDRIILTKRRDVCCLNYYKNYLYFIDNGRICKMNISDERYDIELIHDDDVSYMAIYKEKIYFIACIDDVRCLYSMNLDGTNMIRLSEDHTTSFYIYNDKLYYQHNDDIACIYEMSLHGENKKLILSEYLRVFYVYQNSIYYIDGNSQCIGIYNIITQEKKKMDMSLILANSEVFDEKNGDLYFTSIDLLGRTSFKRYNAVTDDLKVITNKKCEYVNLMGNKILYFEDNVLFWMETTGKNIRRFPCL